MESIPTSFFVLVIVRRGDRFLLVREAEHGQGWYLPAGHVERGEFFVEAAERETLEEAGIQIRVDGVLCIQHTPEWDTCRVRAVLTATPTDDTPPKNEPDEHTLGAQWFTLQEVDKLYLREPVILEMMAYVAAGGTVYPPTVLMREDGSFLDQLGAGAQK